jgi:hypothetical protein
VISDVLAALQAFGCCQIQVAPADAFLFVENFFSP